MMFAAGLSWKYIFAAFAAAGAAVAVAFAFFSDKIGKGYQWYRILAVLDPENTTGWAPSETVWKNMHQTVTRFFFGQIRRDNHAFCPTLI